MPEIKQEDRVHPRLPEPAGASHADPTRARTATRPRPVRPLRPTGPTGSARLRTPNRRGELPASHLRSYHLLADSGDRSCFERGAGSDTGVRFAGRDKLVYLVGLGEVVERLGRGVADRLDRTAQVGEGIPDRNQAVAFRLHGLFFHVSQTTPKRSSRKECRLTTIRHGGPCGLRSEMRSAERAGKSVVFLCRKAASRMPQPQRGGCGMAQTRNAAEPLSFISLIPLWLSPVNRRDSLRTREIEKDESAPPQTGGGM